MTETSVQVVITDGRDSTDRMAIGRIRRTHGVLGSLRVVSYSGEIEHFRRLPQLTLRKGGKERRFEVESMGPIGIDVLVKLAGVDSPESGKELVGWEVVVARSEAAPLSDGEYYVVDLCACVVEKDSRELGRVCAVCEGGNGSLLEIEVPSGKRYFVPFMNEYVGEVDLERRVVELKADWLLS